MELLKKVVESYDRREVIVKYRSFQNLDESKRDVYHASPTL